MALENTWFGLHPHLPCRSLTPRKPQCSAHAAPKLTLRTRCLPEGIRSRKALRKHPARIQRQVLCPFRGLAVLPRRSTRANGPSQTHTRCLAQCRARFVCYAYFASIAVRLTGASFKPLRCQHVFIITPLRHMSAPVSHLPTATYVSIYLYIHGCNTRPLPNRVHRARLCGVWGEAYRPSIPVMTRGCVTLPTCYWMAGRHAGAVCMVTSRAHQYHQLQKTLLCDVGSCGRGV